MTGFVKNQQKLNSEYKTRGRVLWTSCEIVPNGPLGWKRSVQGTLVGTFENGKLKNKTKIQGKAARKAAKKDTHRSRFYHFVKLGQQYQEKFIN